MPFDEGMRAKQDNLHENWSLNCQRPAHPKVTTRYARIEELDVSRALQNPTPRLTAEVHSRQLPILGLYDLPVKNQLESAAHFQGP